MVDPSPQKKWTWGSFGRALLGLGTLAWSPVPALFGVVGVILIGLVPIGLYSNAIGGKSGPSIFSLALLLGLAALMGGGLVGFLFGVPRRLQEAGPANGPVSQGWVGNTNLEQISDWLTKILVGVGLTQILQIPGQLQRLTAFLAPAFGNQPSSQIFALGLLGYFSIAGFLIGYLTTRLLLGRAFIMADELDAADAPAPAPAP
ncbi:MAG TPA: hypothetical protein VKF16_00390 [Candidatus Dormibacteraeota bacterium]|nr:hypothetical protein [Candidatus Dormibacteraeota bacterium]